MTINSVLLCDTRTNTSSEESVINKDRNNCMNVRTLKTKIGEYSVCPACNRWETVDNWEKGKEKMGWKTPYTLVRRVVGVGSFLAIFGVSAGILVLLG